MNDNEKMERNMKELAQVLTMQYDYPPNGMGSIGYKGNNLYRFKVDDVDMITELLQRRSDSYKYSYNAEVMAQEIITDLLDDGYITYGGYDFKKQQKEHHSI
jgi:DNA-directed RNA polymerase specialized sigma54-like protein